MRYAHYTNDTNYNESAFYYMTAANIDENHLHFWLSGQGEPVILLHGLLGSSRNLGVLAKNLSEHFLVCAVDLPNHGRSYRSEEMSFSSMAAAVDSIAQLHDWPSYRLLGHSLGGKVAMRLAIDCPEKVKKLLVEDIAPVDYPPHHHEILQAMHSIDLARLESRAHAEQLLAETIRDRLTRSFVLQNLRRSGGNFYWQVDLPHLVANYPELSKAPFNEDVSPVRYQGPVMFVAGERSNYIRPEHRPAIEALFSDVKFRQISGAGHVIHAEKAAVFSSVALRFFI